MSNTLVVVELLAVLAACTASPAPGSDASLPTPDAAPGVDAAAPPDAAPFTHGVSTLAGAGQAGSADGDRSVARFANPVNTLYTPDAIYVADFDNGLVRVVGLDGTTTTLVRQADFSRPFGLARAASGALYVQTDNAPGGAHSTTTGTIWRIDAGSHAAVALATNLGRPRGLAMLPDGRIAMADYLHHVVEVLDPATGVTTILAGTFDASGYLDATGAAARFARPYGVAVRDGALIVADYENHRIRSVDLATRAVTTLAGTGTAGTADGAAADAQFDLPQGVAVDAAGTIYVTDTGSFRIRRIRGTTVDTIAGDGIGGFRDADDPRAAAFWGLEGLAVRPDGAALYVADGSRGEDLPYHRVRVVDLSSQE